jgi:hypothetical protein
LPIIGSVDHRNPEVATEIWVSGSDIEESFHFNCIYNSMYEYCDRLWRWLPMEN